MILTQDRIIALAEFCAEDYEPTPKGIVIDAGNDIRAVIEELDEYLVVSVRGTQINSLLNWKTDFDAFGVYALGFGYVPRGFYIATLSLLPLIGPYVEGRKVITCGHSMGGSVAIQTAASLICTGRTAVAYAAFEPACSGEELMATALKGVEGFISWYGNDPVPLLPPMYRHPCPVTAIGCDSLNPFSCHSIDGVIAWLKAQKISKLAA